MGKLASAGQRIDPKGNIAEIVLNDEHTVIVGTAYSFKNPFVNSMAELAQEVANITGRDSYQFEQEKDPTFVVLEALQDEGRLNAESAMEILRELAGQGGIVTVTYEDDDYIFDHGSGEDVLLTDDLLEKIADGRISDATINIGTRVDNTNSFVKGHQNLVIKEGEVTLAADGMEDYIPASIVERTTEFAEEMDVALTVIPLQSEDGSKVQYVLVDDVYNIVALAVPDAEGNFTYTNSDGVAFGPGKHNGSGGSGGTHNGPVIINPTEPQEELKVNWRTMDLDNADDVAKMLKLAVTNSGWYFDEESKVEFLEKLKGLNIINEERRGMYDTYGQDLNSIFEEFAEKTSDNIDRDIPQEGRTSGDWHDDALKDIQDRMDGYFKPQISLVNELHHDGPIQLEDGDKGQRLISDGVQHAPFQLSYEEGQKSIPYDSNTKELQEKMLRLAELDPNLNIDLGNTGSNGDGADGQFGPKSQAAVTLIEQYLEKEYSSGVADEHLMEALDERIVHLEIDMEKQQLLAQDGQGSDLEQKGPDNSVKFMT